MSREIFYNGISEQFLRECRGGVGIDTESTGLSLMRDRVCLIQICTKNEKVAIVVVDRFKKLNKELTYLLETKTIEKIFHYARFDMALIKKSFNIQTQNVFCTKIASRLARTYTNRHGLKDLIKEFIRKDINKQQQSSDWARDELSNQQLSYAVNDVIYLHDLKEKLSQILKRENRYYIAQECFLFLPTRIALDLAGWERYDIFSHRSDAVV